MMALEKAPMWPVQVVRHVRHSYTFGDVQVEVARDTRCQQRQRNNELIGVSFSLF
jgi:hypothetical protein